MQPGLQSKLRFGKVDLRAGTLFVNQPVELYLGHHPGFEIGGLRSIDKPKTAVDLRFVEQGLSAGADTISASCISGPFPDKTLSKYPLEMSDA